MAEIDREIGWEDEVETGRTDRDRDRDLVRGRGGDRENRYIWGTAECDNHWFNEFQADKVSNDVADNVADNLSNNVARYVSDNESNDIADNLADNLSNDVAGNAICSKSKISRNVSQAEKMIFWPVSRFTSTLPIHPVW